MPRFVVQEHFARSHHFDLRLERDGVFKSWALPKGPPVSAAEQRLALSVEDHTIEFGDFEGTIPEGEYGAGRIAIWDRGMYAVEVWEPDRILVSVHGSRLKGLFELRRFRLAGTRKWLLCRRD
jgi:bifunctional non-homologous end joining protein LigD